MNVDVAICTWNRADMLRDTLQRLSTTEIPAEIKLRIIVVDNNCTDHTQAVVKEIGNLLQIVSIQESRQGHCFARNAAIEIADSEFLIWIDDDVSVSDNWLHKYVNAFKHDSDQTFWGGSIIPAFHDSKPKWINEQWDKIKGCFAYRDLGDQIVQFTNEVLPYGANFAVRTKIQKQFLFDTDFGRQNGLVVGEDEIDVMKRMIAAGYTGRWVPGATVEHIIDPTRTTEAYIEKYFVGQGRALIARKQGWDVTVEALEKESKHELFCYRMKRYWASSEVWMSHLIRGALAQGQLQIRGANRPSIQDQPGDSSKR